MKPIILTTREVRGLLDGTITTIRRPIKPKPKLFYDGVAKIIYGRHPFGSDQISEAVGYEVDSGIKAGTMAWLFEDWCGNVVGVADKNWLKPPFHPGDVLYAKEHYFREDCSDDCSGRSDENECPFNRVGDSCYGYKAQYIDENSDAAREMKWRSPATMPREAARLFMQVEDVRAERVQEISRENCEREGVPSTNGEHQGGHMSGAYCISNYQRVWDDQHAKRGMGWDANPWTWVWTVRTISADDARERDKT